MTSSDGIRIDGTLDGQVDLLDRQVVSSDGRMIAKVDDVELEERSDGTLTVTGLLVGPGALGPRLGGAVGQVVAGSWSRLSGRAPDDPRRIDYAHVRGISTVLILDEGRRNVDVDGLEAWMRARIVDALPGAGTDPDADPDTSRASALGQGPAERGDRHRLSHLTGMAVHFPDGTHAGEVIDVRFEPGEPRGHLPRLSTVGLIVGRNRPGTLFGYDRDRQKGPWIIQMILRRVHRHTGYADWDDVSSIDWEHGLVTLGTTGLRPLPEP
jgi:sporulation protein YlmC with PRC-barrel domain